MKESLRSAALASAIAAERNYHRLRCCKLDTRYLATLCQNRIVNKQDLKALVEIRKKGKRYVHVLIGQRTDGMWYIADHEMGNYSTVSPHNMADIVWQFIEHCGVDPEDLKRFLKERLMGRDYE